ncbi:Protein of unknown function (DUF1090) [Pseudomonas sp. GM24]|jgi:hypothetical protein|uniref:DUF1090 domain-containing protein n=1 Tax=Pseudomonas fluorescens TaxID=294 RepID=A0A423NIY6_PSEFL|nr:Protein of unknown function (DUF1090) [Pseudomonas sp. GM16]EJM44615.1 Protein of unknown function (DUF1090) [Pseudomonas sp. GM24]RON98118.1 hypothetical protein BK672_00445 [Pseudomonas fluorescens]
MRSSLLWNLSLLIGSVLIIDSSRADSRESCAQRRAELVLQIERADKADNIYRKSGLERALANVERYCQEPSAQDDRSSSIQKAEAEVRRRQNYLEAARQYGDVKVIKNQEARLERAQTKLQKLMDE